MAAVRCPSAPQDFRWCCHQNPMGADGHPGAPLAPWKNDSGGDGEVHLRRRRGGTATVSIDPVARKLLWQCHQNKRGCEICTSSIENRERLRFRSTPFLGVL